MADSISLWTFADAVAHVIDSATGTTGDTEMARKARRAVLDAYREFPLRDEWGYFLRRGQFTTEASQSAGTVMFDLTGGTNERELTLSGATWPDSARYGVVLIAGIPYFIEDRISSTAVTLRRDSCPASDLAAGTAYEYYRNVYPVPLNFRSGTEFSEFSQSGRIVRYVSPHELVLMQSVNGSPQSWAYGYTIRSAGDDYDSMSFELTPPPCEATTFTYLYHADPRPLQVFGSAVEYSTGTVAVSGTAVVGTGTAFAESMIGSVIRFPAAGTTTIPTGTAGAYGNDNPYAEYRIVTAVADTENLTIDQAPAGAYSGVKYTIGDPLDLDYHVMLDAFLAMCDWKFAVGTKQERRAIESSEAAWIREFGRARAKDYRSPAPTGALILPRYWNLYAGVPM